MMKKTPFVIGIFLTVFLFAKPLAFGEQASYEQFFGEVIGYDVRSLAMKMADARIELKGLVKIDGREAYLITFEAKGSNFFDNERIYADTRSLYPIRVERDVTYMGSVEKIIEIYDQQRFSVAITKTTKARPQPENFVIQKKGKIDNIYCFIYRYRLTGDFKIGSSLQLSLPTKDVLVKIAKTMTLDAAGKTFDTFYLETVPTQYRLWFDISKHKIPLRIDKPAMVGGTSMIMNNYMLQGVSDDKAK